MNDAKKPDKNSIFLLQCKYTQMQKSEYTQWVFSCSKSTMKTLEQVVYLFKVNKKKQHQNNLTDMKTGTVMQIIS